MKIRNNCLILLILLVVIAPAHLFSMPPQTGTWEPRYPAGVNSAQRSPALRDDADIEGTWNCLVILIDFEDYPWDNQNDTNFANTDAYYTSEHFDQMLFSEDNYQHPGSASDYTGSMHDYYREISSGVFETVGVITPWLRAPHPLSYYCNSDGEPGTLDDFGFGEYPNNAQELVEDALELADDLVDYSDFDNDGNGEVDALFIAHAGPGAEELGGGADAASYIWSHQWQIFPQMRDGVTLSVYSMEPENGTIGVYSHEFGHVLGLPDIYDTDGSSEGVGEWCLMGSGGWCFRPGDTHGTCPSHMCGWAKMQLDWADVVNVTEPMISESIPPVEDSGIIYRLWTNGLDNPEYFLLERRMRLGFDAGLTRRQIDYGLPAPDGLLITHIDENQWSNEDDLHRLVDVEEASPVFIDGYPFEQLDGVRSRPDDHNLYNSNRGDNGDLWPGFTQTNQGSTDWTGDRDHNQFSHFTIPSSFGYDGRPSLASVDRISLDVEGNLTCDLSTSTPFEPLVYIERWQAEDLGNQNGYLEPGEEVTLTVLLNNLGGTDATNVLGNLSYEGEWAEIISGETPYIDISPGIPVGPDEPFQFRIAEDALAMAELEFGFSITCNDSLTFSYPITIGLRPPHEWFKYAQNPVLSGVAGTWDDGFVFSPAIIVEDQTVRCWYLSGIDPEAGGVEGIVGYAWSEDGGITWERNPDPILDPAALGWISGFSGIDVERIGDGYLMAFDYGATVDSNGVIGLATSADGINWNLLDDRIFEGGEGWVVSTFNFGPLSLLQVADTTYLAFTGMSELGWPMIGVLAAGPEQVWELKNSVLPPGMNQTSFDGLGTLAPDLIPDGDSYLCLYSGIDDNFTFRLGTASFDGNSFTKQEGLETGGSVLEPGGGGSWGEYWLFGGRIFDWNGERRMLFTGMTDAGAAVGLAYSEPPPQTAPGETEATALIPGSLILNPAFPNPFNSAITVGFNLTGNGVVQATIYDLTGRQVTNLTNEFYQAGNHRLIWQGLNQCGIPVSGGIYFLRLSDGRTTRNTKLVLVK